MFQIITNVPFLREPETMQFSSGDDGILLLPTAMMRTVVPDDAKIAAYTDDGVAELVRSVLANATRVATANLSPWADPADAVKRGRRTYDLMIGASVAVERTGDGTQWRVHAQSEHAIKTGMDELTTILVDRWANQGID